MGGFQQDEVSWSEKRRSPRWNIPVPVHIKVVRNDGTTFEEDSITADVSATGMCVLLAREVERGDQVSIQAPEEGFESAAFITRVSPLGLGMNRVRVVFPPERTFSRRTAGKKYVYDYENDNWVGYISEGTYFNSKHEPFGRVKENTIVALDSEKVVFTIKGDRVYNVFRNCIGRII
ncbi:MAG: PilZ domain-containing protein [Acidobacteria bacterium]|nr:PilZ domain-containing protein [Acidobacteriota bacterium]